MKVEKYHAFANIMDGEIQCIHLETKTMNFARRAQIRKLAYIGQPLGKWRKLSRYPVNMKTLRQWIVSEELPF